MIERAVLLKIQESRESSLRQKILARFLQSGFRLARACGLTDVEIRPDIVISGGDVVGIGVDLCDVDRMGEAVRRSPLFRTQTFRQEEIDYCMRASHPAVQAQRFAGRFAASEAGAKALGGMPYSFLDFGVTREPDGKPGFDLQGKALEYANSQGVEVFLSLSHIKNVAIAFAVAVRKPPTS